MKTKYTHLILLVLLFLSVKQLYGQSSTFNLDPTTSTFIDNAQIECIYKYTVNAPLRNTSGEKRTEIYNTILQANGSVSKFWDWHSFKEDSIIYSSANELSKDSISKVTDQYYYRVKDLFVPVILKNYPKEKITVTDEIIPEDYYYVENKTTRNWVLINDTLTVCGYLCNKAETSFGGKKWTAWYAPEISIADGPWKLYGLPGLILKAEDSTGIHSFEAVAIRQSTRPIYVAKNILQIKIKKEQFIKNKDAFEKDPEKSISMLPQTQIGIDENLGIVTVNEKRTSVDDLKRAYCPLEFE
jgi:GLPGLI family protein